MRRVFIEVPPYRLREVGLELENYAEQRIAFVGSRLIQASDLTAYLTGNGYTGSILNLAKIVKSAMTQEVKLTNVPVITAMQLHPASGVFEKSLKIPTALVVPTILSFEAVSQLNPAYAFLLDAPSSDARGALSSYWEEMGHGDN